MHALQTGFPTIFMSVIKRHCVEAQPQHMGSETGQTALLLFNSLDSSVAHCHLLSFYKQVFSNLWKVKRFCFPASHSLTHQPTLTDQVCLLLRDRAQEAKEADHSKYKTMMIVMTMIMAKEAIIQRVCTPRIHAIVIISALSSHIQLQISCFCRSALNCASYSAPSKCIPHQ